MPHGPGPAHTAKTPARSAGGGCPFQLESLLRRWIATSGRDVSACESRPEVAIHQTDSLPAGGRSLTPQSRSTTPLRHPHTSARAFASLIWERGHPARLRWLIECRTFGCNDRSRWSSSFCLVCASESLKAELQPVPQKKPKALSSSDPRHEESPHGFARQGGQDARAPRAAGRATTARMKIGGTTENTEDTERRRDDSAFRVFRVFRG